MKIEGQTEMLELPADLYDELLTGVPSGDPSQQLATRDTPEGTKIYCKFCKGYYYEEYHFGDQDE